MGVSEEDLFSFGLQAFIPLILQSADQEDAQEQQSASDERVGMISFVNPDFSTIK